MKVGFSSVSAGGGVSLGADVDGTEVRRGLGVFVGTKWIVGVRKRGPSVFVGWMVSITGTTWVIGVDSGTQSPPKANNPLRVEFVGPASPFLSIHMCWPDVSTNLLCSSIEHIPWKQSRCKRCKVFSRCTPITDPEALAVTSMVEATVKETSAFPSFTTRT